MRLNKKVNPSPNDIRKRLTVPRAITLFQKCVEHNIQNCLIERLHFNDLYVLILSLDIANLKQILRQRRNAKSKADGNIEIRDISQEDAVKFLKGGG